MLLSVSTTDMLVDVFAADSATVPTAPIAIAVPIFVARFYYIMCNVRSHGDKKPPDSSSRNDAANNRL